MRPFSGSYESSCNSSAAYPYDDEGGALSPREADDLAFAQLEMEAGIGRPSVAQQMRDVEHRLWLLENAQLSPELEVERVLLQDNMTTLERVQSEEVEEGQLRRREIESRLETLESGLEQTLLRIGMLERELSQRREQFTMSRRLSEWEDGMTHLMEQLERAEMDREYAEVERTMLQNSLCQPEAPLPQVASDYPCGVEDKMEELRARLAGPGAGASPAAGGDAGLTVVTLALPPIPVQRLVRDGALLARLRQADGSAAPVVELEVGPANRSMLLVAGTVLQCQAAERIVQGWFTVAVFTEKRRRDWDEAAELHTQQLVHDVRRQLPLERGVQSRMVQFLRTLRDDVAELVRRERTELLRRLEGVAEGLAAEAMVDGEARNAQPLTAVAEESMARLQRRLGERKRPCLAPQVVSTAYAHWLELLGDILRETLQTALEAYIATAPLAARSALRRKLMKGEYPHLEMFQRHAARFQQGLDLGGSLTHALFVAAIHSMGAAMQLPIYLHSDSLLARLQHVDVLAVPTNAGSGKTALLPALLAAEFGSCIVTQPRSLLCLRTKTYVQQKFGIGLVDWESPRHQPADEKPRLRYVAEASLVGRLLADPDLQHNRFQVIFLDEVHERTKGIDLAVLALARQLATAKADGRPTAALPKVILGSATLDPALLEPFRRNRLQTLREIVRIPSPFPVHESERYAGFHFLTAVVEVFRNRQAADEQVLCFVANRGTVDAAVAAFWELTGVAAVALHATMPQAELDDVIKRGLVFFSTNIAATSLTFPRLMHVVDCGRWVVKYFDEGIVRTEEEFVPLSIAMQRKGRCGRVCEGTYYPLYRPEQLPYEYAVPELITQSVVDEEFLMWTTFGCSFAGLERFWPGNRYVGEFHGRLPYATGLLRTLGAVDAEDRVTELGQRMAWLPEVGGVRLRRAVVAAFEAGVGRAMLLFCAAFSALPENSRGATIGVLPDRFHDPIAGDAGALLSFCHEALMAQAAGAGGLADFCAALPPRLRQMVHVTLRYVAHVEQALLGREAKAKGTAEEPILARWLGQLREATPMDTPEVREQLAKCLLMGYFDHASRCMAKLQGPREAQLLLFMRRPEVRRGMTCRVGEIDPTSLVRRGQAAGTIDWVFCLELTQRPVPLERLQRATMCTVVPFRPEWLTQPAEVGLQLYADEDVIRFDPPDGTTWNLASTKRRGSTSSEDEETDQVFCLRIEGPGGLVGVALEQALSHVAVPQVYYLEPHRHVHPTNYAETIRQLQENLALFDQWTWQWQHQHQVTISIEPHSDRDQADKWDVPKVSWQARPCLNTAIRATLDALVWELTACDRLLVHFPPYEDEWDPIMGFSMQAPRFVHARHADIRDRIRRVTDSERRVTDLWAAVNGPEAARMSRMEVVAFLAVTRFEACLWGAFVRDWVVGGWSTPLLSNDGAPEGTSTPKVDLWLSPHIYFDLQSFLSQLSNLGLEITSVNENPRCVAIEFDAGGTSQFGPFTAELTFPHMACCHVQLDLDVNNLYLVKDATQAIGLRLPLPWLSVPKILNRIQQRRFVVCKQRDADVANEVQKMVAQGWTEEEPGDLSRASSPNLG
eukprot:EG_transcript_291